MTNNQIWQEYENGKKYLLSKDVYTQTDVNYRFFEGRQWEGDNKLNEVNSSRLLQYNFIAPIVKYKTSIVAQNNMAISFNNVNFSNQDMLEKFNNTCTLLNEKASKDWER